MNDLIVLDKLTKTYETGDGQPLTVLDAVDWTLAAGAVAAVVGPSGSGKSTLLNLLGALDRPTSGNISVGETRLDQLASDELAAYRAAQVGFVFQDHHLLPQLTALENVLVPTLALPEAPSDAPQRAEELLTRVGLGERLRQFPAQLSGGERQRVALARALMNRPRLLLCDEPTGNLDQATGAQVVDLLLGLAAAESLTVVMVTHNPRHAGCCHEVYELREGQLRRASPVP